MKPGGNERTGMARILLIDDEAPLRRMAAEFLKRSGHEVVTAADGCAGLQLVTEQTYDLIITDLFMPNKEGIETIKELRRSVPGVPVIAISGGGLFSANDNLNVARLLGAKATLAKPFSGLQLVEAVKAALV